MILKMLTSLSTCIIDIRLQNIRALILFLFSLKCRNLYENQLYEYKISEDSRLEKATALINTNKRKHSNKGYLDSYYFQETMFSHYHALKYLRYLHS